MQKQSITLRSLILVLAIAGGPHAAQAEADIGRAPPTPAEHRYHIVKATETTVWRLDRQSGDIVACQFDGAAMVCGAAAEAVTRPKSSYDELKRERAREAAEERALKRAEREDTLSFILGAMRSMLAMAREFELERPRTPLN
jgi:hypothetical protein